MPMILHVNLHFLSFYFLRNAFFCFSLEPDCGLCINWIKKALKGRWESFQFPSSNTARDVIKKNYTKLSIKSRSAIDQTSNESISRLQFN